MPLKVFPIAYYLLLRAEDGGAKQVNKLHDIHKDRKIRTKLRSRLTKRCCKVLFAVL